MKNKTLSVEIPVNQTSNARCEALPSEPVVYAYTIREAAQRLRMSEKSVRRQIDRGRLRRCKGYGRVLIPIKDVDNYFEEFAV
jgi:excisionase family DNA binding protein